MDLVQQFNNYQQPQQLSIDQMAKELQIYDSRILEEKLSKANIDAMDDIELSKFVKDNIFLIINKIYKDDPTKRYVALFHIPKFVDAWNNALSTFDFFDQALAVRCNTICYDYFTWDPKYINPVIVEKMYDMSRIVNRIYLPRMLGLGIPDKLCNDLLVARFSNFNMDICVKRINFILIRQPVEFMTEELMENIIRILFKPETDFQKMFKYHMFNVNPDSTAKDSWITEDMEEVDSAMNLSVLNILEALPEPVIFNVIKDYSEGYTAFGCKNKIRFSLRSISYDYPRINMAVEMLINNGTYIP